jgi:hypothetical protein
VKRDTPELHENVQDEQQEQGTNQKIGDIGKMIPERHPADSGIFQRFP